MSKNKDTYGAACKPIHKSRNRHDWKFFFQIFIFLVLLAMPTTLWADLVSLRVDSNGDTVFRGGVDRLRIVFTVDDSDDEDPYIVEVGKGDLTERNQQGNLPPFDSLGVIEQGVVSADETVELFWDGTLNGIRLPDDTYTIQVTVDDGVDEDDGVDDKEVSRATATLNTSEPRVSGVFANEGIGTPITDGIFITAPLRSITVTGTEDADLANRRNTVFLRDEQQVAVPGNLNYDGTDLTFTLIDPLDEPDENGKYT